MQSLGDINTTASRGRVSQAIQNYQQPSSNIEAPKENEGKALRPEKKVEPQVAIALERANKKIATVDRKIERTVHEGTKAVIYKIRDTKSNEVISEFPSEHVQTIIAKLWEVNGLMVDHRL